MSDDRFTFLVAFIGTLFPCLLCLYGISTGDVLDKILFTILFFFLGYLCGLSFLGAFAPQQGRDIQTNNSRMDYETRTTNPRRGRCRIEDVEIDDETGEARIRFGGNCR